MTKEDFSSEKSQEQYHPKIFLDKLCAKVFDWLIKDEKGEKRGEVDYTSINQSIKEWDGHFSINILKGVFIKTQEHDWALVLGSRIRSQNDKMETVGVQFGLMPSTDNEQPKDQSSVIKKLKILTSNNTTLKYGDFFIHPITKRIKINCWADHPLFEGQEIEKWEQERLLTDEGLNASLEIVQRTAKKAFL